MPYKPLHPCGYPGCPELIPTGNRYCEQHKRACQDGNKSAASRGYGSKWRKASRQFLESHPLCVECLKNGILTKATVVDHVIPHRGNPELFWDKDNWQALCKRCHDRKTVTQDMHPIYHY